MPLIEDPVPRSIRRPLARASNAPSSPRSSRRAKTRSEVPTRDRDCSRASRRRAVRRGRSARLATCAPPNVRAELESRGFRFARKTREPLSAVARTPLRHRVVAYLCVWSTRRRRTRPAVARLSTRAGPMALALRRTTPERFAPPSLPRRKTRLGRIEVLFVAPTMPCALSRRDTSHAAPLARATCERPHFSLESSEVRPARSPALSSAW